MLNKEGNSPGIKKPGKQLVYRTQKVLSETFAKASANGHERQPLENAIAELNRFANANGWPQT